MSVTPKPARRDKSDESVTAWGVTASRAHAPTGYVTAVTRDSDRPPLRCGSVTVTDSAVGGKGVNRFASWLAGASKEKADRFAQDMARRGPQLLTPEQQELFRLCGERILENHRNGRKVTPEALADGQAWAALPKLPHSLSSGDPVPDDQLPPALRGGALEVF